jgi:UDP-glucose 4-epimerase
MSSKGIARPEWPRDNILVTGSRGKIGRYVKKALEEEGFSVREFDLALGLDVRSSRDVQLSMPQIDVIVHLAAIPRDGLASEEEIMSTNVFGTWTLLEAAKRFRVRRIIHASSVNAIGVFMGQSDPRYLPIDSKYRAHPLTPYSRSKRLAETSCRVFTEATAIPTVSLRIPRVLWESDYDLLRREWAARPESEWIPFWEYGIFIDVRDVASAVCAAVKAGVGGHHELFIAAEDSATSAPVMEMLDRLAPGIAWRGGVEYERNPSKSLLYCGAAKRLLSWTPTHRWGSG